jgi:hypothetical protein
LSNEKKEGKNFSLTLAASVTTESNSSFEEGRIKDAQKVF